MNDTWSSALRIALLQSSGFGVDRPADLDGSTALSGDRAYVAFTDPALDQGLVFGFDAHAPAPDCLPQDGFADACAIAHGVSADAGAPHGFAASNGVLGVAP